MAARPAYLRGRGRGRGAPNNNEAGYKTTTVTPMRQKPGFQDNHNRDSHNAPIAPPRVNNVKNRPMAVATAEEKFQAASREMRESVRAHLDKESTTVTGSVSSDSEDDISDTVLNEIFKSYNIKSTSDGDAADNDMKDLSQVQDDLLHNFRSSASACLICIESIKKEDPMWSCNGCFCMFHIPCIQKWVREGVNVQIYQSEESPDPRQLPWFCPKCRHEYTQTECPTRYYCFCGKIVDPKFDPWHVAHSCGETCGRPLKPDCGHTCRLLCHPGPCPACPQTVRVTCHCGRQSPVPRRCSARPWSCGVVCGRTLSCGQHQCSQPCHAGDCSPCLKTSTQPCQCGVREMVRQCADATWRCDKVCGRALSCGHHVCEVTCHVGSCGTCPRAGDRKCPCGKTKYSLPCVDEVPTCGDTCAQVLECGAHSCDRRCHNGECGQCREMTRKRCRCGQKLKEVPCSKEYLCESRCTRLRDCGNHPCKRKCCDGSCPQCEQICNKPLRCRNHKCASRCHRGPCYVCPLSVDVTCFCGQTKIRVPCGKERATKPPRCYHTCQIPPDCHHPTSVAHRCHFKLCPSCSQKCHKSLPGCKHVCPVTCHTALRVTRNEIKTQRGPWDKTIAQTIDIVKKPCPPCKALVNIQCYGQHETSEMACCESKPYSCENECGCRLPCTHHTCSLPCHVVTGARQKNLAGRECETCEVMCDQPRPPDCKHSCARPCHPGPCDPCIQIIRMRCHCQSLVKHIKCYLWRESGAEEREVLQSCAGACQRNMPCGHVCGANCHKGPCPMIDNCQKRVPVRCPCRRKKKDFTCHVVSQGGVAIECDNVCVEQKRAKKLAEHEAKNQKDAAELQKQQAELEAYERRLHGGKRRRQKKEYIPPKGPSLWKRYKNTVCVVISLVVTVGLGVYLFNDEF